MRIALAQMNSVVGDFNGNRQKTLEFVRRAAAGGADIVVFPELNLFGYSPWDLLEREDAIDAQLKEFDRLVREIPPGIGVLVGLITRSKKKIGKPYHNSAALIEKGKKPRFFHKELLPTYDVFDESRYVEWGDVTKNAIKYRGRRILVTICEDIWGWELRNHPSNYLKNPLRTLKKGCCEVVLNLSASPFTHEKTADRNHILKQTAKHFGVPVVYVNLVGGQDEIIFDGGSMVVDANGKTVTKCVYFSEDLNFFDLDDVKGEMHLTPGDVTEFTRQALVLGLRDFIRKTGQERVHLGLSGGIDSAVVACLAVEALGAENVTGVIMPGPFNSDRSRILAEQLAKNLGIRCLHLPIDQAYEATVQSCQAAFGEFEFGLVNENLQARLRGLFLMALSNKTNSMLLTTGNKSEYASGYATLYGDMCGGLAPLGDLTKSEVYDLAKLYNTQSSAPTTTRSSQKLSVKNNVHKSVDHSKKVAAIPAPTVAQTQARTKLLIPEEIITRAPTAELRPNQTDQDTLPPYDELDKSVRRLIEEGKPARTETERWLIQAINRSEFKRWQAPPILKVSKRAFGRGRRFPIANKFKF